MKNDVVKPLRSPEPTTSNARTYAEHEAWVKAKPDYFRVVAFRGGANYERVERKSLAAARRTALSLKTNRPVMIYAVRGVHGIHVENV